MTIMLNDHYSDLIVIGDEAELNGTVAGNFEARYGSRVRINGTVTGILRVARGATAYVTGTVGSADVASGGTVRLAGTVCRDMTNRGNVVVTGTIRGGVTNLEGQIDLTTEGRVLNRPLEPFS